MAANLQLPADVEALSAEQILGFVLEQFPGRVALACSFQKEETVLLDMLFALEPKARVFAIDTHYLFPETYAYWRDVEQRYGTSIERVRRPAAGGARGGPRRAGLGAQARPLPRGREGRAARHGARRPRRLDHRHPPRPVADARQRTEARLGRAARALEGEPARGLDRRRCAGTTSAARELPYNPLHDQGYASIGDTHSTQPGEGRAGRWAGTDKTECGIHTVASGDVKELLT